MKSVSTSCQMFNVNVSYGDWWRWWARKLCMAQHLVWSFDEVGLASILGFYCIAIADSPDIHKLERVAPYKCQLLAPTDGWWPSTTWRALLREGLKKKKKWTGGALFVTPPPHWDVDRLMWYFFTYFFNANKKIPMALKYITNTL